jgi:DNA ligase (NAD+)
MLHRRRLHYFVSKHALNIDGLGPKIMDALIEHNLVSTYADIFTLSKGDIAQLPHFKEKATENLFDAIKAAKTVTFARLLVALSIDHVGTEMARIVAEHFGTLEKLRTAHRADIEGIHGVGEIVAVSLHSYFRNPLHARELHALIPHLTIQRAEKNDGALTGKTFVFTGTMAKFSRDEAGARVRAMGAHVANSVSQQTSYVVVGSDPGSKFERAKALGVAVLTEREFEALTKR